MIARRRCSTGTSPGFTLVEVMVVVVIIALGVGVVLPGVWGSMANMGLKKSMRDMCSVFRYARARAISRGVTVTVTVDLGSKEVTLTSSEPQIRLAPPKEEDSAYITQEDRAAASHSSGKAPSDSLEGTMRKSLYKEMSLAWESFFSSELQHEGAVTVSFFPKGNCLGGILYFANRKGVGYYVFLDAVTGLPNIGKDAMTYDWAVERDEE